MSKIAYDPVKDRFARLIRKSRFLRTVFYRVLDLFFLRSWYVRSVIRRYAGEIDRKGSWDLLDAGCGFGQYDRFLLNRFNNISVTAIDVKEDYLDDCRSYFSSDIEAGRIRFKKDDLLELNYDRQFDFTICIDVLEHIHEDRTAIRNLANALKPGGYFLMHSPSHFAESDAGEEDTFVGEHARTGYSREEITEKIKKAGMKPEEVVYTYGPRGHFAWVMLIKYPMLWFTRFKLLALPLVFAYYLLTLPVGLLLMKLDMNDDHTRGTGIYALARKPE